MVSKMASISKFHPYVSYVEGMASAALRSGSNFDPDQPLSDLLDGQAGVRLRETIHLQVRRELGAFFSSSDLRAAALTALTRDIESNGPFLDPAVGAGDLLIEVARRLPVGKDLRQTLRQWGHLLHGRDVEPAFVRLTKARLVLLAASRGATATGGTGTQLVDVMPQIRVGDGLDLLNGGWCGGHIVMNPPFTYNSAPKGAAWASGRTNLAAIFLAAAVECAQPGSLLTAILPDVIRTGSRYDRLRSLVADRLHISAVEPYGRFDAWTDVDVFVLRGMAGVSARIDSSVQWWHPTVGERLGDRFDVFVGPVVPHRDPESEPTQPYLHARATPLGGDFDVSHAEHRGFRNRSFSPPFVVIRRTSRPGDRSRGIGTTILGTDDVLVENHLIVLRPKDGSIDACRGVVDLLESKRSKQWLDGRIRCRHLTVRALREMPWFDS